MDATMHHFAPTFPAALADLTDPVLRVVALASLVVLILLLLDSRRRLRAAEAQLRERLKFEQLVSSLSAVLLNTPPARIDVEIERALEQVRHALRFDCCQLIDFLPGS